MKIQFLALFGLVIFTGSLAGYRTNWKHKGVLHKGWHPHGYQRPLDRHHWRSHVPTLNVEVYEPKGLKLSMVRKSQTTSFLGVELYINKDPRINGTQCDVCRNTTTVTFGKFVIEDENVVVKTGDQLNYVILIGNSVKFSRQSMRRLQVTSSMIRTSQKKACNCETTTEIIESNVSLNDLIRPPERLRKRSISKVPVESSRKTPNEEKGKSIRNI
ncbi:uncharacterized protein LOC131686187 isoform X2 [Topomyia yanbarensis]|uniref:uncharacterized protein LOC131686187 isoform X2 n=1 Tax=Topomyia yanbarensis TaxID=2498891 RepID=UPI00273C3129|nr:uncharacterized protein LOC131686187 isoform X2 [Topomyia yanbarensis]